MKRMALDGKRIYRIKVELESGKSWQHMKKTPLQAITRGSAEERAQIGLRIDCPKSGSSPGWIRGKLSSAHQARLTVAGYNVTEIALA